jgi:hypothetical protein
LSYLSLHPLAPPTHNTSQHTPLTLDPTVSQFYSAVHAFWANTSNTSPGGVLHSTSLVSISGASRDETVPSHLTDTTARVPSSISVLAPVLAKFKSRASDACPCGTDHRAIVWCREILLPVRDIIFSSVSAVASSIGMSAAEKRAHYERTVTLSVLATKISESSLKAKPMLLEEIKSGKIPPFEEQLRTDEEGHEGCLPPFLPFIQSCASPSSMEMLLVLWVIIGIFSLASLPISVPLILVPPLVYAISNSPSTAVRSLVLIGAASLPFVAFPSKSVYAFHLPTIVLTFPLGHHLTTLFISSSSSPHLLSRLLPHTPHVLKVLVSILHLLIASRRKTSNKSPFLSAAFALLAIPCIPLAASYGSAHKVLDVIVVASLLDTAATLFGRKKRKRQKQE